MCDDVSLYDDKYSDIRPFLIFNENGFELNLSNLSFILNSNNEVSNQNIELDGSKNIYKRKVTKIKEEDKRDNNINISSINIIENFTNSENNNSIKNIINYLDENTFIFSNALTNNNSFIIFNKGNFNDYTRNKIVEVSNETSNIINKNPNKRIKRIKSNKPNNIIKTGKKIKYIKKRKDNTDSIRKKILCKFFKILRKNINDKLKSEGAHKFFKLLPTNYILAFIKLLNDKNNINNEAFDITFQEIFSEKFCEKNETKNLDKNLSVLSYLEKKKI